MKIRTLRSCGILADGNLVRKFTSKIDRRSNDECWNWPKPKGKDGYGFFRIGSKVFVAHRVSWELFNGPIPEGRLILHKCDNKWCVNPRHLYLGTHSDNMKDKARIPLRFVMRRKLEKYRKRFGKH